MTIPEKPQGVIWTDAQWQVFTQQDKMYLLQPRQVRSKTAVLVERIIQKIFT